MNRTALTKRSQETGLTLLEVVIAMFVLFFAIMSVLEFFSYNCKIEAKGRDRTRAVKLAQQIMEEQMSKNPDDIQNKSFEPITGSPDFQRQIEITDRTLTDVAAPSYTYNIKEVKVTVRGPLDNAGNPYSRTINMTMKVWRAKPPTLNSSPGTTI